MFRAAISKAYALHLMAKAALIVSIAMLVSLATMLCVRQSRAAGTPGLVAFIGVDHNIFYCEGACRQPICVTCTTKGTEVRTTGVLQAMMAQEAQSDKERVPASYGWPTFSPDGSKLAYTGSHHRGSRPSFAVEVYDLKNETSSELFESPVKEPIYIFWASNSENISFLAASRAGLELFLTNTHHSAEPRVAASGVPLYYDWLDSRHQLAVHTNTGSHGLDDEQISLVSLPKDGKQVDKVLSRGYAPFKAPAWSPNHEHLAYVAMSSGHTSLFVADASGAAPKAMATLPAGENSVVWSPDSRSIAFATGQPPRALGFTSLNLLDLATGSVRNLTNATIDAYFFSPNSRYLACIETPPSHQAFRWKIIDLISGKTRDLGSFVTTREETIAYRYFDQLALSHSIWSPDSKAIVFAGRLDVKHNANPLAPDHSHIWMLHADGSTPRTLADGILAFWSPASAG